MSIKPLLDRVVLQVEEAEEKTKIESAIELSKSVEGVEVLGYTKEARVKHMKQIFEDYKEK